MLVAKMTHVDTYPKLTTNSIASVATIVTVADKWDIFRQRQAHVVGLESESNR